MAESVFIVRCRNTVWPWQDCFRCNDEARFFQDIPCASPLAPNVFPEAITTPQVYVSQARAWQPHNESIGCTLFKNRIVFHVSSAVILLTRMVILLAQLN